MTKTSDKCRWQEMQDDIGAFTDKTFGHSTVASKMAHLKEECDEVTADPQDLHEWADCLILLLDAARRAGHNIDDLHKAVSEKMDINKKRNWGTADQDGVVRHVD